MGYHIVTGDSRFILPSELEDDALDALIRRNRATELVANLAGPPEARADILDRHLDGDLSVEDAADLEEALSFFGWEVERDGDDEIERVFYDGRSGPEEAIFDALAPYVEDGSWIEVEGEDGESWIWVFEGGEMEWADPDDFQG